MTSPEAIYESALSFLFILLSSTYAVVLVDECSACCCQVAVEVVVTCVNTRIDLPSPAAASEDSPQRQIKISFAVLFFFFASKDQLTTQKTSRLEGPSSLSLFL